MSLALGIDIGTSGVRTAVIDETGACLSMARTDHVPQNPDRIDADLWWQAVETCLRAQLAKLADDDIEPGEISRIAVDGTSGTMVIVDGALAPASRALMYNSAGFAAEAGEIARYAPASHITRGANSALARAMRLASEADGGTARYLLHQADFIVAKLTGEGGLSDHNNALKTGFDPDVETWPEWAAQVIAPDLLPKPAPVGAPLAMLHGGVARDLGLSPNTVVHAGTTDSIAAFLAASPLVEGYAVTSIGSTLAIKLLSATRIDDPEIGLYAHRLGDMWLVGGASNTGGAVLSHYFSVEEIERLSALIGPGQNSGLDYYPLLRPGERFPINDPDLAPRLTPRPDDDAVFLHGLMEGIATVEDLCYRAMVARGAAYPSQIVTAGGAAKSEVLTAIRSNRLAAPLRGAKHTEAAIGAAMCCFLRA
ncbi:MAG: FGGY-family carbohydrate kinase [Pseudomonadota bacterium]